jgi:hypothetical protein
MTYIKVLTSDGRSFHGGHMQWSLPHQNLYGEWIPGEWHTIDYVEMCFSGYHSADENSYPEWMTQRDISLWELEYDQNYQVFEENGKYVGGRARLLKPFPFPEWWQPAVDKTEQLALLRFFNPNRFFNPKPNASPDPAWAMITYGDDLSWNPLPVRTQAWNDLELTDYEYAVLRSIKDLFSWVIDIEAAHDFSMSHYLETRMNRESVFYNTYAPIYREFTRAWEMGYYPKDWRNGQLIVEY